MAIKDNFTPYILEEPAAIATKYGGNKQLIAKAAAMGTVDPTAAVLAGMFIDQMRGAAAQEQVSNQSVAEKVFAPPQPQIPAGLGATPQAQQMAMAPAQPPMQPPAPGMADGGLASLPVDESMFPDEYAGGGIVAFAAGDFVDYRLLSKLNDDEREIYYKTGKLPTHVQYPQGTPLAGRHLKDVPVWEDVQLGGVEPGMTSTDMLLGRYSTTPAPKAVAPVTPSAAPAAGPAAPPAAPRSAPTAPAAPAATAPALPAAAQELSIPAWQKQQKDFGIAEDPMAEAKAKLASMAGESKLDREFAKNMALVQAGLSIMGGTSPYALTNVGKGASEAVATYNKDLKDIKSAERDIFKMQTELAKADDARKRGDFKAFQEHNQNARDYALKLEKLDLDKKVAEAQVKYWGRPGTYEELGQAAEKYPWLKERFTSGARSADVAEAKVALASIDNALLTMKKDDPKRKELEQRRSEILQRLVNTSGAGGAGGTPSDISDLLNKYK